MLYSELQPIQNSIYVIISNSQTLAIKKLPVNLHFDWYCCMARNIGMELTLVVDKIKYGVSPNFIPPTFNPCILLGAYT